MTGAYPFDPDVREHVARLLYEHLPALYRVRDEGGDLRRFLAVLAAPLAELRQNIEELHGDLFIDTCNDWIIPQLARMVGVDLIFPDAASNRRDVRGAVAWRRRKGTRDALEEMASDLSGQMVVTHEGWKRLLCAQDLNLLRPERKVGDVRRATIAEAATGPLDAAYHVLDPRSASAAAGRYHPGQIVHWVHPTRLFRVREGVAFDRTRRDPGDGSPLDPDLRYAVHPLGVQQALRVRREQPHDPIPTDRVRAMHFAATPGLYFDQEGTSTGRFAVRLSGLPAAVAAPVREPRQPSRRAAEPSLVADEVAVALLERPADGPTANVRIDVYAVPLDPLSHVPEIAGGKRRGGVLVRTQGPSSPVAEAPELDPVDDAVAMVRVRPVAPATAAYFPGATIEIAGSSVDALHASAVPGLAAQGFLRGALVVEMPRTWVHGDRWFFVAADGSVVDAQSPQAAAAGDEPDLAVDTDGGSLSLPGRALTAGPGPAWPELRKTAVDERMNRVPSAPGRGPVFLHGGPVRQLADGGLEPIAANHAMALSFAARVPSGGAAVYHPFLRLRWVGESPFAGATWEVLNAAGVPLSSELDRRERLQVIAEAREAHSLEIELVVRFEAEQVGLVLPPCEVAFTSDDGQTVLIHLPSLETIAPLSSDWAASPAPFDRRSLPVSVGADGSTRFVGGLSTARYALGPVAPLRTATLRRRRVRQRTLCGWDREKPSAVPPVLLGPTSPGFLDVDPEHGLFAIAAAEPPLPYPPRSGGGGEPRPSPVTVDYLEGASDHIGARPDAREPLLGRRQPKPTRIVSASGRLHPGAPAEWHAIPRYFDLPQALAAAEAAFAASPAGPVHEIIQLEDSATYVLPEVLTWPALPAGAQAALTLQAAEEQRPVLWQSGTWGLPEGGSPGHYASVTLRGLVISSGAIAVPAAERVAVQFCSLASPTGPLTFRSPPGLDARIEIVRSVTAALALFDQGLLRVLDSIIDSEQQAIIAPLATAELERVTVLSRVPALSSDPGTEVLVLEATESIFLDRVRVHDRFHGCIRYSRAPAGSVLPRRHRVTDVAPRFVSRLRHDPAHARLATDCAPAILRGAEDGSEMGAFHGVRLAQRQEALVRRLVDFTPAGLLTGVVRMD